MKRTLIQWAFAIALLSLPFISTAATVNLNTANAETLASELKGIGASKADAIVRYRQEHGKFSSVSQLSAVPGIGDKTVEKLKSQLSVK